MLHDVGILIEATSLPDHFERALRTAKAEGRPLHVVERELEGVTHAELGAYLLGLWGLPYPIVEAVALHHRPDEVDHRELDVLAAVCIDDALALEADAGDSCEVAGAPGAIDAYVETVGALGSLEEWRELSHALATAPVPGA